VFFLLLVKIPPGELVALWKQDAEEKLEIAGKMKNAGRPLNEIEEFTGLPAERIEKL